MNICRSQQWGLSILYIYFHFLSKFLHSLTFLPIIHYLIYIFSTTIFDMFYLNITFAYPTKKWGTNIFGQWRNAKISSQKPQTLLNIQCTNELINRNRLNETDSRVPPYVCIRTITISTLIRVITKLPNSEQSYKGKVKTHKYINRQNQSTTGKLWKP
jgi:hypothetical protein